MTGHSRGKISAGLLLYRRRRGGLDVLLAHPGGPYWRNKDDGAWSIPKGEIESGENPLQAAQREFAEETGHCPQGEALSLGSARQPSGKIVHVFALEGEFDPARLVSGSFEMEWPPRSGRVQSFPEIDRAAWFSLDAARTKIIKGQAVFLDRLRQSLKGTLNPPNE
jgi:predicted NUDIX family NTP pyrophosphohydrolase